MSILSKNTYGGNKKNTKLQSSVFLQPFEMSILFKSNHKKHQKHIWSRILKTEMKSIFNHKKHIFYNQISTDGFSVSILFIDRKFKNKKFGEIIKEIDTSDEEDNYIPAESLTKEQCDELLNGNYKFISNDPGWNRPCSMIDENGKYYSYSAGRRRFETYTKRSAEILYQEKKKDGIFEIETSFSKIATSRTMNYEKYMNFIKEKFIMNNKLKPFYHNILWRKLQFRRYVRTKQADIKMLNEIENCYLTKEEKESGKKLVIMAGDYGRSSQMKGCIPTKCPKGIKRLLASRFLVHNVNEDYSSQLYHKTHSQLENVVVKNKHNKKKHLHQVLTLNLSDENKSLIKNDKLTKCKIFVNRDKNACKNILHIALYFLRNQKRPERFCRKVKEEKTKKSVKKTKKPSVIKSSV
jgi:hypothetical protein